MSHETKQDCKLIAACDNALRINEEFNRLGNEGEDDLAEEVGNARQLWLDKVVSIRAVGLAALRAKAAVCSAISNGIENSTSLSDILLVSLLTDLGAIFTL
jgi:hypothetical protein